MSLKQNWTEVKKQLKYCSERDLLGLIQDLYKLNHDNRDYLNLKFLGGNSPAQKESLLAETIDTIQKRWNKAKHDPYGYGGEVVRVKITPIKEPVVRYKKALGSDRGYVVVLAEYIIYGHKFLKRACVDPIDVAINSINSIAKELFDLIYMNDDYIDSLSSDHLFKIKKFINSYEVRNKSLLAYQKIQDQFDARLKAAKQ
ncbi:hypothetical protein L3V86_09190 [Thiotrichales bacterium 19S11-10]|nr:hypothetical protein [Thiotrichales bacterium 19S11-10]